MHTLKNNQIGPLKEPVLHDVNVHYPQHEAVVHLGRVGLAAVSMRKVVYEVSSLLFNNANTDFTSPGPFRRGSVEVYHDGEKLTQSEIVEVDSITVRLPTPPAPGASVFLVYVPASFIGRGMNRGVKNILTSVSAPLTIDQNDNTHIIADTSTAAISLILATVGLDENGMRIAITRIGSLHNVTITPGVGQTIKMDSSFILRYNQQMVEFVYCHQDLDWVEI